MNNDQTLLNEFQEGLLKFLEQREDQELLNEFQDGLLLALQTRDVERRQCLKDIRQQVRDLKFTEDEINALFEDAV